MTDPQAAITAANLVYVDDGMPGITRRKRGRHWQYFSAKGDRITDRDDIDRLNRIALPPAYVDAWFCPSSDGHIQATGMDEKGRKQYRYHLAFRAQQDAAKYEKLADFGRALPLLRARVDDDLSSRKLDQSTVLAALVRLLDLGHIRVGNEAYTEANNSYGATTLRNRHAKVQGAKLRLEYKGKSGKMQKLTIEDRRLASIVRRTQDLPGQHLFEYVGDDGTPHPVGSAEVNAYIREAMGGDFTAKHFRTWGASVIAYRHIVDMTSDAAKLSLKTMLEPVAAALGNTPAISRKSYVHPALIELCRQGETPGLCGAKLPRATRWMDPHERGLIAYLDEVAELAEDAAETPTKAA